MGGILTAVDGEELFPEEFLVAATLLLREGKFRSQLMCARCVFRVDRIVHKRTLINDL
jgi:hypothetical protein